MRLRKSVHFFMVYTIVGEEVVLLRHTHDGAAGVSVQQLVLLPPVVHEILHYAVA